jgi:hypothetical protein
MVDFGGWLPLGLWDYENVEYGDPRLPYSYRVEREPRVNLYTLQRALEDILPPLDVPPGFSYGLEDAASRLYWGEKAASYMPIEQRYRAYTDEPIGLPRGAMVPFMDYIPELAEVAAKWSPGSTERPIGERRTLAQQREYENEFMRAMQWGAGEPPSPPDPTGYWQNPGEYDEAYRNYQRQLLYHQTQEKAWDLFSPTMMKMFGPETIPGGGIPTLRGPISQRLAPAPRREALWTPTTTQQNWTFTPRWG